MNGRILLLTILIAWSSLSRTQNIPDGVLGSPVYASRRAALQGNLDAGTCAVVFSGGLRPSGNGSEVPAPFAPAPDFFYLTGIEAPHAVLVLFPKAIELKEGSSSTLLFLPDPNQAPLSAMGIGYTGTFGLQDSLVVRPTTLFRKFCIEVLEREGVSRILTLPIDSRDLQSYSPDLLFRSPEEEFYSTLAPHFKADPEVLAHYRDILLVEEKGLDALQKKVLAWLNYFGKTPDPILERFVGARDAGMLDRIKSDIRKIKFDLVELEQVMHDMRRVKTPSETELIRSASALAGKALQKGLATVHPGQYAWETEAEMGYEILSGGGRPARSLQVLSGPFGDAYLASHNQQQLQEQDLMVLDVAVQKAGYSGHVARTAPVSGKFSPETAAIYDALSGHHQRLIRGMVPGARPNELALKIQEALVQELDPLVLENGQRRSSRDVVAYVSLFPIGLELYEMDNPPALQPGMVFEVSTVLTVPRAKRFRSDLQGLGMVLRDVVLVRDGQVEWISTNLALDRAKIETLVGKQP